MTRKTKNIKIISIAFTLFQTSHYQMYFEDKNFEKITFGETPFVAGEYEYCRFEYCDFTQVSLANSKFIDCIFSHCNLSLVSLLGTAFRNVKFFDAKLLGLRFDQCNTFGLSLYFENCNLQHTSFYRLKLKKTIFKNCQLQETDYSECDLSQASFEGCDLRDASFDQTNLEKADFRKAYHYTINPNQNRLKQAQFSMPEVLGLLSSFDIKVS